MQVTHCVEADVTEALDDDALAGQTSGKSDLKVFLILFLSFLICLIAFIFPRFVSISLCSDKRLLSTKRKCSQLKYVNRKEMILLSGNSIDFIDF